MSKKSAATGMPPKPESSMEELVVGGAVYKTQLTKKFRNRTPWMKPDTLKVVAVIPGTIQKIMVKAGQEVESGDPLLILEAMKMRNEVLSPVSGRVAQIFVKEGEHVPKAHLLVKLK
jgi:biotin carboxyl carrier protein